MTASERRATLVLASILILRMTALFMVLPVIAPHALALAGHPGVAIGLAVGAYGLTQALLQIPLGALSDRIGRKPVIAGGLMLFAAGSLLAAQATSIDALVVARLLQGGGAIAAASTALLADLTRETVRTTAMAIIGASIGGAFLLALILGPALLSVMTVPDLFWLSALAAGFAALLLLALPEAPRRSVEDADGRVLVPALLLLDVGVFLLHAMLAGLFVGLPLLLEGEHGWAANRHWQLYLPVMVVSLLPVFPLIRIAENRGRTLDLLRPAAAVLAVAGAALATGWLWLPLSLTLFFCAFNLLEASLPSLVARLAPPAARGRAMGVFASAQFLGAFVGAAGGGWALGHWGARSVLFSVAIWGFVWLGLLCVRNPARNASMHSASHRIEEYE